MKKKLILLSLQLFICATFLNLSAKEYYISNNGNDKSKGTSPETSFETLHRLNQEKLKPGDKVFFKAGDVFTGTLHIKFSGKPGKPITYSSYGKGEKPVINGTVVISGFKSEGNNIYSADCRNPINSLYKNDTIMICARYPNSGFLHIDEGGNDYLVDHDLLFAKNELEGATIRIHVHNWYYDYRTITGNDNSRIHFISLDYEPNFFRSPECRTGYDYYIDNKKAFLDTINEWYYAPDEKKMYIYSEQPATGKQVFKGAYIQHGAEIVRGVSDIRIENMKFYGQTETGINAQGDNKNIEIDNNEFHNISEVGIYSEKTGNNFTISNNYQHDISGGGIKLMHIQNSLVNNNRIERIGLITGYGRGGLDDANGICVLNYEIPYKDSMTLSHHNIVRNNYIEDTGYDGIRFDGHSSVCESNIIKNSQLTLHDGGGIYCSVHAFRNSIRNNIIIFDKHEKQDKHIISNGIYLDYLVREILVEGNIICNYNGGILSNRHAYDNNILNNLVYGCQKTGIIINVINKHDLTNYLEGKDKLPFKLRGNVKAPYDTVTGNTIVCLKNLGSTLTVANHRGTELRPGLIDSNLYVSPNEKFHIQKITVSDIRKKVHWKTLEGWQKESGKDKNSVFFSPQKNGKEYPTPDIFINEGKEKQTFSLNPKFEYIDLEGNVIKDNITLEAGNAKVVFYKLK